MSYLLWGLMQERIATRPYETGELFKSSKFLVFANRFLSLIVGWAVMNCQKSRAAQSHGAQARRGDWCDEQHWLRRGCLWAWVSDTPCKVVRRV